MPFVSLRHHTVARLYDAQFDALQQFEELHPELYKGVVARRQERGPRGGYYHQSLALDHVMSIPEHAAELNQLIAQHPMRFAVIKRQGCPSDFYTGYWEMPDTRKQMVPYIAWEPYVKQTPTNVIRISRSPEKRKKKSHKKKRSIDYDL